MCWNRTIPIECSAPDLDALWVVSNLQGEIQMPEHRDGGQGPCLWASVSCSRGPLCSIFRVVVALHCMGNWGTCVLAPLLPTVTERPVYLPTAQTYFRPCSLSPGLTVVVTVLISADTPFLPTCTGTFPSSPSSSLPFPEGSLCGRHCGDCLLSLSPLSWVSGRRGSRAPRSS